MQLRYPLVYRDVRSWKHQRCLAIFSKLILEGSGRSWRILTNTCFDVAIRQRSSMKRIIDILTAWGVNTANQQISQILSIPPIRMCIALWRYDPAIALFRQAIQDGFPEGSIRHVKLQQQTFLLCFFALYFPKSTHKVTFGVSRGAVPAIYGDQDLLPKERRRLTRA